MCHELSCKCCKAGFGNLKCLTWRYKPGLFTSVKTELKAKGQILRPHAIWKKNFLIKNTLQYLGEECELQNFGLDSKLSNSSRIFIPVRNFGLIHWREESVMSFGSNFRLCYHKSKRTGRSHTGILFFLFFSFKMWFTQHD